MTKCTHKQLMTACMLAGTLMLGACTSTPPVTKEVSIVPITNHLEETNGAFVLKSNTSIGVIDAELIPAAEYLADMLSSATGYDLKVKITSDDLSDTGNTRLPRSTFTGMP